MITKRTNRRKYMPITVESQQSNGEWSVRNTLKVENDKARSGAISRDDLVGMARKLIILWICNSDNQPTLRVGGVKQPNPIGDNLVGDNPVGE